MRTTIKSLSSFNLALMIFVWFSAHAQSATWQTVSSEPPCTARHEAALTALDGKLYLLGGRGVKPVEEYDPQANSWKKLAPTPMEFHHFQALVVDGRILVFGAMSGGYPKEKPVANLWWFNPKMNEWTKGTEIPERRRRGGAGAVFNGDRLFLVCGITNGHWNGFVSWVDVLDIKSGQWTILPDAPRPRDHFQAALVGGRIVLAGGRTTYGEINKVFDLTVPEVDVFDIATRRWTTPSNNIPTQRAGCLAVVRDGKVCILGGESVMQPNAHSEVEALSLPTGQWESLPALTRGRHGTGAAFIGDTLYVAAGCGKRGGNPELNSMEKVLGPALRKTE